MIFLISSGVRSAKCVGIPMGDTAFALGLFVMGNSRSLFALMACLEIEKIQKMLFSDFDSPLCAPTVRIFKLEPVCTAGGCRAGEEFCARSRRIFAGRLSPGKKFNAKRGQKARLDGAWAIVNTGSQIVIAAIRRYIL